MHIHWKRWMSAVVAVAAADAAILLTAGLVIAASQRVHDSALAILGMTASELGTLVPPRIATGLDAILSALGAGWWQQHLVGPALSGQSSSGAPILAGVLAAPVYTVVRRKIRPRAASIPPRVGAPPHRVYVARAHGNGSARRVSAGQGVSGGLALSIHA